MSRVPGTEEAVKAAGTEDIRSDVISGDANPNGNYNSKKVEVPFQCLVLEYQVLPVTFTTVLMPGRVPWYQVTVLGEYHATRYLLPIHHTWSNGTALTNKKFRWQQAENKRIRSAGGGGGCEKCWIHPCVDQRQWSSL